MTSFIPVTPAGTMVVHLESDSFQEAVDALVGEAGHMPYNGWDGEGLNFFTRGYRIVARTGDNFKELDIKGN